MDADYKIFVATIYGEAAGQSEASWKAIANVIVNRLEYGGEWKKYDTPVEIIKGSGFDAYTHKNATYVEASKYLNGEKVSELVKRTVDRVNNAVKDIYDRTGDDNASGAILYYSPKAQEQLYGKPPSWNFSLLEEVKVKGAENDDFKFFRYKKVAKYKFSARRMDSTVGKKEVQIEIDGRKKVVETSANGELPTLVTDMIGKKIIVSIKNSKNEFVEVYNSLVKEIDVAIDFVRNKVVIDAATKKHIGAPEPYTKRDHIVQSGQTLSQIAMIYNVSINEICVANKIQNPNKLKVGQKLIIKSDASTAKKKDKVIVPPAKNNSEEKQTYSGRDSKGQPRIVVGVNPVSNGLIKGLLFPIAGHDRKSYKKGAGIFGYARSKDRKHGGCDIYAPVGTPVKAVADGVVVEVAGFYCKTHQVTVDHGSFMVRYGEVNPKSIEVKTKDIVKRGDVIAYVGQLIMKGKPYKYSMLHFELYSSAKPIGKSPLTNKDAPYKRRDDLINPTFSLDAAENE